MIERLMTNDFLQDNPGYQELTRHIAELRHEVSENLDSEGRELLDQLADAYISQSTALLNDAFIEGFCTAVDLALDYLTYRQPVKTNQQHPPGL